MQRILAAVMAAALLGTATTALAQTVYTETTAGWAGDEPNVASASALPFCVARHGVVDPSCDYPADANNLGPARATSADTILNVEWRHDMCLNRAAACYVGSVSLLKRLNQEGHIVPGLGQWWAWYGRWQDLNGDGWIEDQLRATRVAVSTRGDCQTTPATNDPNGIGQPQGVNTGLSARCVQPEGDEWQGDGTAKIAAYVTPGDYNEAADFVNGNIAGAVANGESGRVTDRSKPDFYMQGRLVEGENTGQYFGPSTNFDYVMIDASLLETTVIEVISNYVTISDGERTDEAGPNSLVDVDLFSSVDPTVESLYQTTVVTTANGFGCDVDFTDLANLCPGSSDTSPVTNALADGTDSTVGPVNDVFFPKWEREQTHIDYSDAHLYLDQRLDFDTSMSLVGTHSGDVVSATQATAANDGKRRPLASVDIEAIFGVWTDLNNDGFVGDPRTSANCPDEYNCGAMDDPNIYDGALSGGEWVSACGSKATAAPNPTGSYYATLTSSTGSWGSGVYVLTDRRVVQNSNQDTMMDDGRSPFNPYDDLVLDVADDGDVDGLKMSGPIVVHMFCSGTDGEYFSYERLFFLDGVNRDYDIRTTGTVTGDFTAQGVPAGESVTDEDVYFRL